MNKTRSLLVIMLSAAAVAMGDTPASSTPPTPATAPTPQPAGTAVQGPRAGAMGNPDMMRERMRRIMSSEGEGMILRRLTSDPTMIQELGLSDTQVKEIKDSMAGSEQELKDLNGKLEQAGMRQVELMKADTLDEEALMKAVQESGDISTAIAKLRVKQLIAAHKVLTPEQRTKLRETMKQRMEQAQQRMKEGARDGFQGANRPRRQPGAAQGGAVAPQPAPANPPAVPEAK